MCMDKNCENRFRRKLSRKKLKELAEEIREYNSYRRIEKQSAAPKERH